MLTPSLIVVRHRFLSLATRAAIMLAATLQMEGASQRRIRLVADHQPTSIVVCASDEPLYAQTARKLVEYIEQQTDVRLPVVTAATLAATPENTALILLDGTKERGLLQRFGVRVDIPPARTDAYHLKAVLQANRSLVVLAGNSAQGAKYAAYRLMEELTVEGRNALVAALDVTAEPFIKTRVISFGNIWRVPIAVERKYNLEGWPIERLAPYIDMYDYFGFNAIEVLDRYNEGYLKPCFGITRDEWRRKVWTMCDEAHLNGQKVFFRGWGNAVMAIPETFKPKGPTSIVPTTIVSLCTDCPDERMRWELEVRDYYVNNYARYIDHFIGHWCDAGGCFNLNTTTTIKTPMLLQNELQAAFRKVNPKIETSFSLWFLGTPRRRHDQLMPCWRGYTGPRSVSGAGVLEKDVCIAQITRAADQYKEQISLDLAADGHRPSVWSWHRADKESQGDAAMHIRVHGRLGEYFHRLPESARALEWHNVEVCQHGMANAINHYVAGKLMWDPKADVDALVLQFGAKMCGPENAPKIARAYTTLETVREPDVYITHTRQKYVQQAADMAKKCQDALRDLAGISIDPQFRPRIPLIITPQQIVEDLTGALTVVNEYYLCHTIEMPALARALKAGDTPEAQKLIDVLSEKRASWWGRGIAGLYEARLLELDLKAKGVKVQPPKGDNEMPDEPE